MSAALGKITNNETTFSDRQTQKSKSKAYAAIWRITVNKTVM